MVRGPCGVRYATVSRANHAPRTAVSAPKETEDAPLPEADWPKPPSEEAYHGLAGDVVRQIEPSTEADAVGVLVQFVVGFGSAVGSGLSVLADGHHHRPNEFVVTVGDTSRARKGTAWRRVRPILAHGDPGWADERITGGLSSGEGLIWEIRDASSVPTRKPASRSWLTMAWMTSGS